ncbi:hypothetical protein KIW84_020846 [Lathyrus oleraceus]|uniref:Uncharacterized protein n=1 Tax=Pisum sativum TaxID=3888 RepID=A0A9D4YA60_PEA|nr:hypothetical protein KIW84_020846 [Pisum sativum]
MILELFLDSMTIDLSDQVVIGERTKKRLKVGKIQNATTDNISVYPLQNQKPTQGNQKQKHKQTIQGNNDQERRRVPFDLIPMSYFMSLSLCLVTWPATAAARRMRPADLLRVLNKQFLGLAGDTANAVAKKLTSPPPPLVSRKPAFIDAFLYKMKKNPELLKNKSIWS